MKRLALILVFLATPVFAADGANYSALDNMQEKANSYIFILQQQRNAALDQVVALTAEIERMKKEKETKKSK